MKTTVALLVILVTITAARSQDGKVCTQGGVLRYKSDGDVRSPFLGLKFAI